MTSLAKRERYAIAQTLRNLGPDAPTLCEGWTSFDLLVHLISRENRPDAAIGILIPAFSQYSKKVAEDIKQRGFETLVQEFEDGPKQFSPFAIPGIDNLANSFEFLVHHEDLLRAQPNYVARVFVDLDKKLLWKRFTQSGRLFLRKAKVGIIAKSDQGVFTIKSGNSCVTMEGDVVDLILYSFGRKSAANIKFEGDEESIRILEETKFGL
jgi:uncharacterized protein (TIGR03085 family)